MDRTGQTLLGKYELTRMLGKGGMGEVWEGEHTLTGRRVAVKILADNYLSNRKVVARFGREARAASSINHPGIVEILDQDKMPDGVPFLVMEFLEGESVGERIRKQGKLSQDEALAIMLPLLDALDAAHQAGIIHRDLKPDNVLILPGQRGDERIKILDFGISQKADEIEHHLTQEGSVLGTPHYMSPEQARGEVGIDGRADVYAAGVMFYECVVGDVPFDAGNYNALLQIILGTPPPSPRSRGADISPAIEQVLLAAMDKKRDRRPPSARAFHDLLLEASVTEDDAMLDVETWTFSTPSEPPPPVEFGDELDVEGDSLPPAPPPSTSRQTPKGGKSPAVAKSTMDDPFGEPPSTGGLRVPPPPAKGAAKIAVAAPRGARVGEASPYSQQVEFADPGELDGDLFSAPPQSRNNNTFDSLKPAPRGSLAPLGTPSRSPFEGPSGPPSGPMGGSPFDAGPKRGGSPFDAPPPGRGGAPFDAAPGGAPPPARGGAPFDAAPPRGGAPFGAAPKFNSGRPQSRARPMPQPYVDMSSSSDDSSIAKTIANWVMALVAIAALGYLMHVVFTRPDPRKKRLAEEAAQQDGAEKSEEGASPEGENAPAEGEEQAAEGEGQSP